MQSKADSFMEVLTNLVIGFVVSMSAWVIASPATGIYINLRQNLGITAVFTVVSLVRQYCLRRLFNRRSPWESLKLAIRRLRTQGTTNDAH